MNMVVNTINILEVRYHNTDIPMTKIMEITKD